MNIKVQRVMWGPSDWIAGTATLTLEEKGLYDTALNLIYLANGPVSRAELRPLCNCTTQAFNRILIRLIEIGKLTIEDGLLDNRRCEREIKRAQDRIERNRENGKKSAIKSRVSCPISETETAEISELATPLRAKGESNKVDSDFKILQGDVVAFAPCEMPASEQPVEPEAAPPEPNVRPPTEAEKAAIDALVERATAALSGKVPKGDYDIEAYRAEVKARKFANLVRAVNNWVSQTLDGELRLAAWEVLAHAERAGARSAMTPAEKREFDRLVAMFRQWKPCAATASFRERQPAPAEAVAL